MRPPPSATANAARSYFDLYTPRFTKGRGPSKLGLCPICIEPKIRGGEGRAFWGAMKVSAYKYVIFSSLLRLRFSDGMR